MGLASWWANEQDPRYAPANLRTAPTVEPADLARPSSARTGTIWGSLFRSLTGYTRFTGGLCQLAEDGRTEHPIRPFGLPYQQAGVRPSLAGPQCFYPKLSAFTNKALGAANADRDQASGLLYGPMSPIQPERSFAVPIAHFWDQFPRGTVPPFNRQPGYVTPWPSVQMTYNDLGSGG